MDTKAALDLIKKAKLDNYTKPVVSKANHARIKLVNALKMQHASVSAMLQKESFVPTRVKVIKQADGSKVKQEMPLKMRHWFEQDGSSWSVTVRYGAATLPIHNGKNRVWADTLEQVRDYYAAFLTLAESGHFDSALSQVSEDRAAKRSEKKPEDKLIKGGKKAA